MLYLNEFMRFLFKSLWAFILYASWSCLLMGLFVTDADFWCRSKDFHHGQVLLGRAHGWARPGCKELETSPAAVLLGQGWWPQGLKWGPGLRAGWGEPWRRLGRASQMHCCPQDPDILLTWSLDELVLLHFQWVAPRWVPGHASACAPSSGVQLAGCASNGSITMGMFPLLFRWKLDVIVGICLTKNFKVWPKLFYRLCIGKLLPFSPKCSHLLEIVLAVQLVPGIPHRHLGQVAQE